MIIGASTGLGRHIAATLAQQCWNVCGIGRRAGRSADLGFDYVRADLADWTDIARLKARLAAEPPDLVVFNAAVYAAAASGQEAPEELEALFRVNAIAPYALLYEYVAGASASLRTCVIVNSDAIFHANLQSGVYAASKAALRVLTATLAHAAKSSNAAAATLLLGPLADDRKRAEFSRIAERRGIAEAQVVKTFLERSNPAFVIDALLPYDACTESVKHIVALGRAANGMVCKLDGGSSGSLF
ncbi:SDR family NAD(P)-dependent oxidoreductase [Bradyrhizobium sp. vgs-9]|uniref:SDR family NAD(P)-dependent oxidoreductase n=1 Tax=Bradyrhizobium sp. vgs-9 TaxID=208389 RepID=UPI0035D46BEA